MESREYPGDFLEANLCDEDDDEVEDYFLLYVVGSQIQEWERVNREWSIQVPLCILIPSCNFVQPINSV